MTKPIDMMTICVKDKGYTLAINFKGMVHNQEHAYSNLDDLQAGIADLLGPKQITVGIDLAKPGSDITVTALMHRNSDGTIETVAVDDDGWREWEGGKHASDYPPGVDVNTEIEIVRRDGGNWIARAGSCNWSRDLASAEIVRYRVVKP